MPPCSTRTPIPPPLAPTGSHRSASGFPFGHLWYQNQNDSSAVNPSSIQTDGHLYSGHVSFDPATVIHVDLNAGMRQEANPVFVDLQKSTWYGVDIDVALARQWYFSFSGLRQQDLPIPAPAPSRRCTAG